MEMSRRKAQSYIVDSQFNRGSSLLSRKSGTLQAIEHLGYIQIDTISVIARAHHHVLWTRVRSYRAEHLRQLEEEGHVFEYWAHAARYLPMRDFRYSLVPKQKIIEGPGHWRPRDKKYMKMVLDQLNAEGPLMSKDFKKDPRLKEDHLWGGHPVTQALRQLFMEGQIMISGRKGFQKIYDLTERVLPDHVDQSIPTMHEYYTYLILRDIKANGLMRATEIGHLISIPKKEVDILLSQLIEDQILEKVDIKGVASGPYFALKKEIDIFKISRRKKRLLILSPFDNLIIQRKRIKEIFDFDYTLECYVPAEKRKVGYFSLPLLWGNEFIGQVDLKADRKNKILVIRNMVWKEGLKDQEKCQSAVSDALQSFCAFNNCTDVIED